MVNNSYNYEFARDWPRIPDEYLPQDVCSAATDESENVYVLSRGKHPFLMMDRDGKLLKTWGAGQFTRAHGICLSPDGYIWCVDDDNHCVRKYTADGDLLQTVGTPGKCTDTGCVNKDTESIRRSAGPFCYPTGIAFLKDTGEFFVTDGYGNARVHHFTPDGELISSFGNPGSGPGEFKNPHAIAIGDNGLLYVADRENDRIQIFEPDGKVADIWDDVIYRPQGVALDKFGYVFVIELGFVLFNLTRKPVDVQPKARVSILSPEGKLVGRIGDGESVEGNIHWSHGIAVSPRGDVYTGEVVLTLAGGKYPAGAKALKRYVRI